MGEVDFFAMVWLKYLFLLELEPVMSQARTSTTGPVGLLQSPLFLRLARVAVVFSVIYVGLMAVGVAPAVFGLGFGATGVSGLGTAAIAGGAAVASVVATSNNSPEESEGTEEKQRRNSLKEAGQLLDRLREEYGSISRDETEVREKFDDAEAEKELEEMRRRLGDKKTTKSETKAVKKLVEEYNKAKTKDEQSKVAGKIEGFQKEMETPFIALNWFTNGLLRYKVPRHVVVSLKNLPEPNESHANKYFNLADSVYEQNEKNRNLALAIASKGLVISRRENRDIYDYIANGRKYDTPGLHDVFGQHFGNLTSGFTHTRFEDFRGNKLTD